MNKVILLLSLAMAFKPQIVIFNEQLASYLADLQLKDNQEFFKNLTKSIRKHEVIFNSDSKEHRIEVLNYTCDESGYAIPIKEQIAAFTNDFEQRRIEQDAIYLYFDHSTSDSYSCSNFFAEYRQIYKNIPQIPNQHTYIIFTGNMGMVKSEDVVDQAKALMITNLDLSCDSKFFSSNPDNVVYLFKWMEDGSKGTKISGDEVACIESAIKKLVSSVENTANPGISDFDTSLYVIPEETMFDLSTSSEEDTDQDSLESVTTSDEEVNTEEELGKRLAKVEKRVRLLEKEHSDIVKWIEERETKEKVKESRWFAWLR